ncbi:hypothetical protein NB640_01480 [Oxalobacter vibrioformis]|uniref:Uncharacterized protein n=1 Tax=Oxalobacter vibrioformis TaxID=933080 RepID=A0A9E9P3L6_9BURK|nr:hypothetical protein [Oxalobacter vibrioformis]WAW10365.1 hypothetical protein NB640_01480 [Oxalobacter vibrioformis]
MHEWWYVQEEAIKTVECDLSRLSRFFEMMEKKGTIKPVKHCLLKVPAEKLIVAIEFRSAGS